MFVLRQSSEVPSWDVLESKARKLEQESGVQLFESQQVLEEGPTNPRAMRRTFGQSPDNIRVKLYRDHAAWCPYCHKVWLLLEEKRIPYVIEKIPLRCYGDKPSTFTAKVPGGMLPVMELDGQLCTESDTIMDLLERTFNGPEYPAMLPEQGSPEWQKAQNLFRLERALFSRWLQWLTSGYNHEALRAAFEEALDVADQELENANVTALGQGKGGFFLGEQISMVDIKFAPFLERMHASLAYFKGFQVRDGERWPSLARWFDAMEKRSTYLGTKSDFYTHSHDLPPQLGGCASVDGSEQYRYAIDGKTGEDQGYTWTLPLRLEEKQNTVTNVPCSSQMGDDGYTIGLAGEVINGSPHLHALEAAIRVIGNHEAVVKFACRGTSSDMGKRYGAELASPTAKPDLEFVAGVDAALRAVVHALLDGVDSAAPAKVAVEPSSQELRVPHVCLAYLRDRVGVPRDMSVG